MNGIDQCESSICIDIFYTILTLLVVPISLKWLQKQNVGITRISNHGVGTHRSLETFRNVCATYGNVFNIFPWLLKVSMFFFSANPSGSDFNSMEKARETGMSIASTRISSSPWKRGTDGYLL